MLVTRVDCRLRNRVPFNLVCVETQVPYHHNDEREEKKP